MAGTLNALGLLTIILVTIYSIVKYGHKPTGIKQILLGVVSTVALLILVTVFTTHMCNSGQPDRQTAITGLCYFLAWMSAAGHTDMPFAEFTRRHFRRVLWFIAVLGFVLAFHFMMIVHEETYTGIPRVSSALLKFNQRKVLHMRELLAKSVDTKKAFQKGWIVADDVFQMKLDPQDWHGETYTVHTLWHTWLTGIYGMKSYQMELWYPGGRLDDAIYGIKYRRRG